MFSHSPADNMCGSLTYPEPKTTALGGVATGNMNAHDAAVAAAVIGKNGWRPRPVDTPASTGMKIVAVAVFDDTSVMNNTMTTTATTIDNGDAPCSTDNRSAIQTAKPDDSIRCDSANPPPNNSNMPQGTIRDTS